jgi:hypothetical protein
LCSSRRSLGVSEYERGVKLLEKKHQLRRRGILIVALVDIRDTIAAKRLDSEEPLVRNVVGMLKDALAKEKTAATTTSEH